MRKLGMGTGRVGKGVRRVLREGGWRMRERVGMVRGMVVWMRRGGGWMWGGVVEGHAVAAGAER
ncbi:hypothetical protein, partial [Prescottella equi]|uniref:hypothetical protein n=1 Tax=Rhodococcus hoagii TaxID=43767 RepID=UPI001C92ED80